MKDEFEQNIMQRFFIFLNSLANGGKLAKDVMWHPQSSKQRCKIAGKCATISTCKLCVIFCQYLHNTSTIFAF